MSSLESPVPFFPPTPLKLVVQDPEGREWPVHDGYSHTSIDAGNADLLRVVWPLQSDGGYIVRAQITIGWMDYIVEQLLFEPAEFPGFMKALGRSRYWPSLVVSDDGQGYALSPGLKELASNRAW